MLGDRYLGTRNIILPTFTNVWNFPKQNIKERKKEKGEGGGGRQGKREGKEGVGHKRGRPHYPLAYIRRGGHVAMTCVVLPGAGLMRKLYTVSKHFNDLNYIWVCGTHHVQTYLKENRGNVSVHRKCQRFLSKLRPCSPKKLTTLGTRG